MTSDADKPDASRGKPRKQWDRTRWLEAYAEHGTVTAACKVIGISRDTAYLARKNDPDFAAAWDKQENAVTDLLEKTAVERALGGSDRLMEFILKARRPGTYRESVKVEHGGKVNVEVEEGVNDAITGYLAEIERLTERLAELAPDGEAEVPGRPEGEPLAPAS
jgi:hypothetical protein